MKSLEILQVLLDYMAEEPGTFRSPDDLAAAMDERDRQVDEKDRFGRRSMFNALGKLHPHFKKWYGRDDLPFNRVGEPGTYRYVMTAAQADAWLRVRGPR